MCFFVVMCFLVYLVSVVFFFKQKTAYEMRISDWSSDVCSSDLIALAVLTRASFVLWVPPLFNLIAICFFLLPIYMALKCIAQPRCTYHGGLITPDTEIGRASCRERVC